MLWLIFLPMSILFAYAYYIFWAKVVPDIYEEYFAANEKGEKFGNGHILLRAVFYHYFILFVVFLFLSPSIINIYDIMARS